MNEPIDLDLLAHPSEWRVVRCGADLSPETGLVESLSVTLQHRDDAKKTLIFENPSLDECGPLRVPQIDHIQIKDTSARGWDAARRLEVSELLEEQATLFWASSVRMGHD